MAAPNRAWTGNITYIPTNEGWLFLAVVIDLFSRRVVGWSMQPQMHSNLVIDALEYLSHSASFHSLEKYAPPNAGTKHLSETPAQELAVESFV